jgi:four helix bundle protein
MKESLIKDKSFKFALEIIKLYTSLRDKKEFVISKQLLRSGTSIGANIKEALSGQSKPDFLSKMYIAFKEAKETEYWLELLDESKLVNIDYTQIMNQVHELIRILSSITKTTSENLNKRTPNSKSLTPNS